MRASTNRKWSHSVTQLSHALDLENHVVSKSDPAAIARSLKRSAERSLRRKSDPYRSAMSMLSFYINRAGKSLSKADRERLEQAKEELRRLFGKPTRSS
jgi:cob(I)alamin adenosyltransferase